MSDLVASIHCDILQNILSEWIDVNDLISLDSAYCSTSGRPLLLAVMSTLRLSHLKIPLWSGNQQILAWVSTRGVFLTELTVHSTWNEILCENLLSRIGMHVRVVNLVWEEGGTQTKNMLHNISLYCKNLAKLSCYSFSNLHSISDVLRECTHLSELHLISSGPYELDPQDISPEIVQCKNLVSLKFHHVSMDEPVACYILKCTPYVKCLVLADVDFVPVSHIISLRDLVKLSLYGTRIEDHVLIEIAKGCPLIQYLDLTHCLGLTNHGAIEAVRSLVTLRSLGMGINYLGSTVLREITLYLAKSLEILYISLYVKTSDVENLLRLCRNLHTLSFNISGINFKHIDLPPLTNIRKLILSGGYERQLSDTLTWLTPHCPKLEFLGLIPLSVYDPNECAGLKAVVRRCADLHTLMLVGEKHNNILVPVSAARRAAWRVRRPKLTISYEYDEDSLLYDINEE